MPAALSNSRASRPRQVASSVAAPEPPISPNRWSFAVVENIAMPTPKPTRTKAISATRNTTVSSRPTQPSAYNAAQTQASAARIVSVSVRS